MSKTINYIWKILKKAINNIKLATRFFPRSILKLFKLTIFVQNLTKKTKSPVHFYYH